MELYEVIILSQLLFLLYLRYLRCKYQHPTIIWNVICTDMEDFERLNDINQRIWEQGFTSGNLKDLETLAKDITNGAAVFERIPYAQQSGLSKGSEVLCAASIICRGCPRTESETRQIYDTDDLFGEGRIQEHLVEQWARLSGGWISMGHHYCMA